MYTPINSPNYHMGMDFPGAQLRGGRCRRHGQPAGAPCCRLPAGHPGELCLDGRVIDLLPGINQIIIYLVAIIILLTRPAWPDGPQRRDGGLSHAWIEKKTLACCCSSRFDDAGALPAQPLPRRLGLAQFNAGYPDLMQRFVIFGIFAIGFNILFGLTGYLSLRSRRLPRGRLLRSDLDDEAADHERDPGHHHVGDLGRAVRAAGRLYLLRRSGIYFSILTLAFAQMSYALAYSVLTPITGGETGLQAKPSATRGSWANSNGANSVAPTCSA
jgi:hypothetical protein